MTRWFKNSASLAAALTLFACSAVQPNSKNMAGEPQTTEQHNTAWDKSYGGADKSFDTELLRLREVVAPKFQTLTFKDDKTGVTMTYNLFIPKGYDPHQSYPLVLFMADASTVGKGAMAPLKQGYGGIIWATDESQATHPSFVLVPAFKGPGNSTGMNSAVNDSWQTTPEVDTVLNLLHHVVGQYNIDANRLYTTGQSMGGMISFYLNATHPDVFAASIFVGSQWDIKALSPLTQQKFFYIVSGGDAKASGGMRDVGDMLKSKGVDFASRTFAANLPVATQDQYVQQLLRENKRINFIQFTAGTVAPASFMNSGGAGEHMYSFDHAYVLPSVRNWFFQQSKQPSSAKEAAKQIFNQGVAYFNGTGVVQDYAKAATLFKQAWSQGHMKALRYLGIMAEQGLDVPVNYAQAMTYYKQAAEAGDITAAARIGWLYERGLGVKQNNARALKWYAKAAPSPQEVMQNIHPRVLALSRLGYLNEKGLGTPINIAQAKIWYGLAAQDGDADAVTALKRLDHI